MERLFQSLKRPSFLPGAADSAFVAGLAEFLADLNAVHPFREGNGRSQLVFSHMLGLRAEHPLELGRIKPNIFLEAMIESFAGRLTPLRNEIATLLV